MIKAPDNSRLFESLVKVVEGLRGPNGCPWDKEQTHSTLTRYAIEEVYEYIEAVESGNDREMCEELGDVLLQVVLNAEVARQRGAFDIHDVIEAIVKKMVSRHPHVFDSAGGVNAKTSAEVLSNWQQIKAREKAAKAAVLTNGENNGSSHSASTEQKDFGLTRGLPALMMAQKIGEKTAHMNFDWSSPEAVVGKVREELDEVIEEMELATSHAASDAADSGFDHSISRDSQSDLTKELGDLLFSILSKICF